MLFVDLIAGISKIFVLPIELPFIKPEYFVFPFLIILILMMKALVSLTFIIVYRVKKQEGVKI